MSTRRWFWKFKYSNWQDWIFIINFFVALHLLFLLPRVGKKKNNKLYWNTAGGKYFPLYNCKYNLQAHVWGHQSFCGCLSVCLQSANYLDLKFWFYNLCLLGLVSCFYSVRMRARGKGSWCFQQGLWDSPSRCQGARTTHFTSETNRKEEQW